MRVRSIEGVWNVRLRDTLTGNRAAGLGRLRPSVPPWQRGCHPHRVPPKLSVPCRPDPGVNRMSCFKTFLPEADRKELAHRRHCRRSLRPTAIVAHCGQSPRVLSARFSLFVFRPTIRTGRSQNMAGGGSSFDRISVRNVSILIHSRGGRQETPAGPNGANRNFNAVVYEMKNTDSMHVTPADGNVFADLGFPPKEAAALKVESDRIIMEKLAIKETLMAQISRWIVEKRLTQVDAAEILGTTRPRVSDLTNKKTIKFSIDTLIDMVIRTGKRVTLSVR